MRQSLVIFGGIGTLVETSHIQWLAFNDAFESLGIDFYWDIDGYRASLSQTGGQQRLSQLTLQDGSKLSPRQICDVHARKTNNYVDRLAAATLELRPGVAELTDHARQQGSKLAWATTTSNANIDALIESTHGALARNMFAFIGNDTVVTRQKPDPQIYTLCLEALGIKAAQAIAIEDSLTGITSAKSAGITTIGFPGEFHTTKDFALADKIVPNLASLIEAPVF